MSTNKQTRKDRENPVSRGRHEHQCRVCAHAKRADIEEAVRQLGQPGTDRQEVLASVATECIATRTYSG